MRGRLSSLIRLAAAAALALAAAAPGDTYEVKLGLDAGEPVGGRVILFFITEGGGGFLWRRVEPIDGPFWRRPQPIASVEVERVPPGGTVTIRGDAPAFPAPLDALDGPARVQAILDRDATERCPRDGPGNLFSDPVTVELTASGDETITLELVHEVPPPARPPETGTIRWVELRSDMLSAFYGRDVAHRAGVVLPPGYDPEARRWPAIYVVPGFGGRHLDAAREARAAPLPAVRVVLDPESPLGHHGFVDSPNHGPRGTALVRELVPHLEERFTLDPRPEARIVTGHSSGGWSSLWLQMQWPEVFGACWASAPDPIDFAAFQLSDLYADGNLYADAAGRPRASYRLVGRGGEEVVAMTVAEEGLMEWAVHPLGGSGQQWDTWEAMFSPPDTETGLPRPMFDARTGAIDHEVVAAWGRFDIARLVREDWARYGPIVTGRVRLACGELDSFYLDRAVRRFKETVDELAGGPYGPGYAWLVPGRHHGDLDRETGPRFHREMAEFLHGSGD